MPSFTGRLEFNGAIVATKVKGSYVIVNAENGAGRGRFTIVTGSKPSITLGARNYPGDKGYELVFSERRFGITVDLVDDEVEFTFKTFAEPP
jgi:hypothetical protein